MGKIQNLTGKGLFVRGPEHLATATGEAPAGAEAIIQRCRWLGVEWLAFCNIFQEQTQTRVLDWWHAYVAPLRDAGLDVWSWGFPKSDMVSIKQYISETERAYGAGALGHIANPEKPFSSRPKAAAFLAAALAELGPLGVVTYGAPPAWHPSFPWRAWLERASFGMPELYSTTRGSEWPSIVADAWAEYVGGRLVPLWSATDQHTGADMRAIVAATPCPAGAGGWWTADWLLASADRSQAVRDVVLGGATA